MKLNVLYEDNHLIAVLKPAGMLVQGDASGERSLMEHVKTYLKETYQKPGNVFLGLIHRLDRPVSGIVLFAKTSKGASRISEQFRAHSVTKIYHAVVEGVPKQQKQTLVNFLVKNENTNKVAVFDREREGALRAELSYELIDRTDTTALLKIVLKTGRPHQIRSQLAHIGHPIVGDTKYGASQALPDSAIKLCATELAFVSATGNVRHSIVAPLPKL